MAEMILYHGSVSIIEQPTFGKGKRHNDYGQGFFCTQSLDLAKEWAVEEKCDGYANKYALDLRELTILDLSQKGFTTLHWIALLLQNRVFTLKNDITKAGKKYCLCRKFFEQHNFRSKTFRSTQIRKFGRTGRFNVAKVIRTVKVFGI